MSRHIGRKERWWHSEKLGLRGNLRSEAGWIYPWDGTWRAQLFMEAQPASCKYSVPVGHYTRQREAQMAVEEAAAFVARHGFDKWYTTTRMRRA